MREETSNNAALASFPMNGVGLYPPPRTPWLGPPSHPSHPIKIPIPIQANPILIPTWQSLPAIPSQIPITSRSNPNPNPNLPMPPTLPQRTTVELEKIYLVRIRIRIEHIDKGMSWPSKRSDGGKGALDHCGKEDEWRQGLGGGPAGDWRSLQLEIFLTLGIKEDANRIEPVLHKCTLARKVCR